MDLMQELGLKATIKSEDDASESLWLRQMDRWGDLRVADHGHATAERSDFKSEDRYFYKPKFRRRIRYQAAILRS